MVGKTRCGILFVACILSYLRFLVK